ncbi:MAG: SDR family oxidoreductase [Deltaproteobacteria bacterium]
MPRVLITGANSGIGRATAVFLAARGFEVFAAMRDLAKGDKVQALAAEQGATIHPVRIDVTDDQTIRDAVRQIETDRGGIDILINNAGVGMNAVVEDVDIEAAQAVFDANFWGTIRCTQAVLPAMRAQGSGHIINISSVAGRIASLGQGIYSASKWAVECLSENLAQETLSFGIRVSIIEPGVTRTAILPKNIGHPTPTAYAQVYGRMMQFYATGIMANIGPEVVAEKIHSVIENSQAPLRNPCAWGGAELCEGRARVSDQEWIELAAHSKDDDYYADFERLFQLSIAPEVDNAK